MKEIMKLDHLDYSDHAVLSHTYTDVTCLAIFQAKLG